ncbi:MAG: Do family serine endopeptidase [Treponema sp.]|nr:Do family serine endopeptidase [Treponema sp.]
MKSLSKRILAATGTFTAAALSFAIIAFSCRANGGSANVAFAQTAPAVEIPQDALSVTQALQSTFRAISSGVLPAVVEVDVTETTKVRTYNPFEDLPFFFGLPRGNGNGGDEDGKRYREYKQSGLGSGVIVRKSGRTVYVLTNNHVAGNATTIKIKLNDEREFDGTLVGADERMDIALVSFECDSDKTAESIAVARMGNSDEVQQGDIVLALGSPLGYFASVTQGIVSATGRSGGQIGSISDFIQTDAAINQGNSGGPLVNIWGEVIGINTWIASQSGGSQGLGFSIPINNIKTAIDQFISKGKIAYGWLGVSLVDITQGYKDELGVGKQTGAFASEIFTGSPAMKGGMQAGDFITELNGHAVKSVDQLVREVGNLRAGETATFTVLRGKSKVSLSVLIEERSSDIVADNSKLWPGFIAAPLTEDSRKQIKLENDKVKGVLVTNVQEKSPAAALRLQNGDVITAVNDRQVTNVQEFYEALDTAGKKEVWYDVYSDGHTISTGRFKLDK